MEILLTLRRLDSLGHWTLQARKKGVRLFMAVKSFWLEGIRGSLPLVATEELLPSAESWVRGSLRRDYRWCRGLSAQVDGEYGRGQC
jgi:hypothetical protein